MFTAYKERLRLERKTKSKDQRKQEYAQLPQGEEIGDSVEKLNESENGVGSQAKSMTNLPTIADSGDTDEEIRNQHDEENAYLRHVYLQKSPYIINGKVVEQIEDQVFHPISFIDAIKGFESG